MYTEEGRGGPGSYQCILRRGGGAWFISMHTEEEGGGGPGSYQCILRGGGGPGSYQCILRRGGEGLVHINVY